MKYFYLFLTSLLLISNVTFSQDLIITEKGDSINCKIIKINTDYTYFTFMHKSDVRSTLLPTNKISYVKDFFKTAEVPASLVKASTPYKKYRINIFNGFSYRVAKIASNEPLEIREYLSELKSGYHFGADVGYFFSENIGAGIKYSNFNSKNERNNLRLENQQTGQVIVGKLADNITIQLFAPTFFGRFYSLNKKTIFLMIFL